MYYTKKQLQENGLSEKEIAAAIHEGMLEAEGGKYKFSKNIFEHIKEFAILRILSNETGYSYNLVAMVDQYFATPLDTKYYLLLAEIEDKKCKNARANFIESEGFDWPGFAEIDLRKE